MHTWQWASRGSPSERFAWYMAESMDGARVIAFGFGRGELLHVSGSDAWAGILTCRAGDACPNPHALADALRGEGVAPAFVGWAPLGDASAPSVIAILSNIGRAPCRPVPAGFHVVALMATCNDAGIIAHTLDYLHANGIDAYLIDNWSTDDTFEIANARLGDGVVGIERFPPEGPADTYQWRRILGRLETLAWEIDADWLVLHDPDERRHTPWPDVGLRAGLHHADACGYNSVDHVVLDFPPTRDTALDPRRDVEVQLTDFTFSDHPGYFHQRKAWKKTNAPVSLASSAGHDVCFPGRRVYPFKFLIKHYPIRSSEHGRRKLYEERLPHWTADERNLVQRHDSTLPDGGLVRDRSRLLRFDPSRFSEQFLLQRLSGIEVFTEAPPWATGPRQRFER